MKINKKKIHISNIGLEASKVGVMGGAFIATKIASKAIGKATDKAISGLGANPNTALIKAVKPTVIIVTGAIMSYAMKDKYAKAAGAGVALAGMEEGYKIVVGIKDDLLPREEIAGFGSNQIPTPTLNLPNLDDNYSDAPHSLNEYEEDLDGAGYDDDEYDQYEELEL